MVTRRTLLSLVGGGVVLGVGGVVYSQLPDESPPTGDPTIRYGEDSCARCRMLISDIQYAAAWRETDGSESYFDDIGCMALLDEERHPSGETKYWVHDYESGDWIDAMSAAYVVSPDIRSPMSYGVVANTNVADSRILATKLSSADVLTWGGLKLALRG